jgi:glycosyltransferase involved in cell wall biosynthesis
MGNNPKISIITVSLNAVDVIEQTIKSVLNQTCKPNIEYIVIDGGSTDGTVRLLNKYQQQGELRYISEPDNGIYYAMNKGIPIAKGEWIYFLGSDDVFFDDGVLERIFSGNIDHAEIIYGNVKYLHSGDTYDGPFNHEKISIKNICHQALFVKKVVFEKMGLFNTRYITSADYEFNLRWMGLNLNSKYVEETIVIYNEKGLSGQVLDQLFSNDFDQLLIENNIVSTRSIAKLKKMHLGILNSTRYKAGNFIVTPIVWLKNQLRHSKK